MGFAHEDKPAPLNVVPISRARRRLAPAGLEGGSARRVLPDARARSVRRGRSEAR